MSFQPFVSRWYFAIPSTIAAESCGRVLVRGHRVVDEAGLHDAVARRRPRRHRGGAPRVARDDRRRASRLDAAGLRGAGARRRAGRHSAAQRRRDDDEVHAERRRAARRARRSWNSSEPPVQTGSEACSPVPVSGAWSPCAASGIHGLHAPPRARTRTSTPARAARRRSGRTVAAGSTRLVRPPSKSAGVTVRPKPRGRGLRAASAGSARSGPSSDPRPAAAPRPRARRRVIVVRPPRRG